MKNELKAYLCGTELLQSEKRLGQHKLDIHNCYYLPDAHATQISYKKLTVKNFPFTSK